MIDTRDIDSRIEDLEDLETALDEARMDFDDDAQKELKELRAFKADLEAYCDWDGGETLIPKDRRVEYAEELANDLYNLESHWPYNHIDWEAAAEELFRYDYTHSDLEGETYYVRMS